MIRTSTTTAATAALIALLLVAGPTPAQQTTRAKIAAVIADVTHRLAGTQKWARSKVGTLLEAGSRVRTARRSKAQVSFPDKSFVRLGELSELVVRVAAGTGREINITRGKLYGSFVKGSPMRITSPQVTAAIRGTRIEATIGQGGEVWKSYDGSIEITTRTGKRIVVGPGYEARISVLGDIFLRGFGAPEKFAGAHEQPWFGGVYPGLSGPAFVGKRARRLREQRLAIERVGILQARHNFLPPSKRGDLVVEVRNAAQLPSVGPDSAGAAWAIATLIGQGILSQVEQQQKAGRSPRISETHFGADAYVIAAEGEWGGGVRLRPRGVARGVYYEVEGLVGTEFREAGESQITGTFITLRDKHWGDLRLGRQRFLKSPVNNGEIGTLMNFTIGDGVTWSPPAGRADVDLAYLWNTEVYDNDPDFEGWYGRVAVPVGPVVLGLNVLDVSGPGNTGITGEFSLPLVPRHLQAYGEVGEDAFGNDLHTWGLYFPGLYRNHRLDAFLEFADRGSYDSQVSLRLYKEFDDRWTGLLIVEKVHNQDVDLGVGFSYTFGEK